jgi:6-phosphogluconate dehydrogenase
MSEKNSLGLIGLAAMGSALARNFASKDINIAVFNRSYEKTDTLLTMNIEHIHGYKQLSEFVSSLERPRKIVIMIKSGVALDAMIELLYPFLENDDIIIDCGNSNWKDTLIRQEKLSAGKVYQLTEVMSGKHRPKRLHFVGCGVSGGEEGALLGPSIMPGGEKSVIDCLLPLLEQVAAKDFVGRPCVTNIGYGPAGHFVKMVHNGIEYAQMQAMAEIFGLIYKGDNIDEVRAIFEGLNTGRTNSFLLDITEDILQTTEENRPLLDRLDTVAGAKGTGRWTVEAAMELGISAPSIAAAVFARISSSHTYNFAVRENISGPSTKTYSLEQWREICTLIMETTYAQGLDIIAEAEKINNWGINIQEVVRIWQGGCIIRSKMLNTLYTQWQEGFDWSQKTILSELLTQDSMPTPVLSSVHDYVKGLYLSQHPTNLTQAQRDYFGAHTYKRNDKEGVFSGGWIRNKGSY